MDDEEKYWSNLEKIYVHDVYENISTKYDELLVLSQKRLQKKRTKSTTAVEKTTTTSSDYVPSPLVHDQNVLGGKSSKSNLWPKVKKFLDQLEPYSLLGDVGCGDGKYLSVNSRVMALGSDRSSCLCHLAASKHPPACGSVCSQNQILICDNLALPFRSEIFDAVISIGVVHHLSAEKRRVRAIQELVRVLKPTGRIMIYVWAMEQRSRRFKSQDVLVPMLNLSSSRQSSDLKQKYMRDLSNNSIATSDDSNDNYANELLYKTASRRFKENNDHLSKSVGCESGKSLFGGLKSQHSEKEAATESSATINTGSKPAAMMRTLRRYFTEKLITPKLTEAVGDEGDKKPSGLTVSVRSQSVSEEPVETTAVAESVETAYQQILDEHKDVLPDDFGLRRFPSSSCRDTFNNMLSVEDSSPSSSLSPSPINNMHHSSTTTGEDQQQTNSQNVKEAIDSSSYETNLTNKRFYHVFKRNELDNLIREHCPSMTICESYYDHGNWCIVATKK